MLDSTPSINISKTHQNHVSNMMKDKNLQLRISYTTHKLRETNRQTESNVFLNRTVYPLVYTYTHTYTERGGKERDRETETESEKQRDRERDKETAVHHRSTGPSIKSVGHSTHTLEGLCAHTSANQSVCIQQFMCK